MIEFPRRWISLISRPRYRGFGGRVTATGTNFMEKNARVMNCPLLPDSAPG